LFGLEFIMNLRQVTQTDLANILQVTPQTVNKWVKQIRRIPDSHKNIIGQSLSIEPKFLDRNLTPQEMVYILSGKWLEGGEPSAVGLTLLQEEHEQLQEKHATLEERMKKVEKESDSLFHMSMTLERYLYTIEDESMERLAKDLIRSVERLQSLVKGNTL